MSAAVTNQDPPLGVEEMLSLLADDPPPVHPGAPSGVWGVDPACLRFLAGEVERGWRTLETGLGLTTALFALRSTEHTVVYLHASEGRRIVQWCEAKGISTEGLRFCPGSSTTVLPALDPDPLDLVVIDGCHGYPFPQIDWYYAAARLREGGIVIVDDIQLPAPWELAQFLSADHRWVAVDGNAKWAAFRLVTPHSFDEEWDSQAFFKPEGFGRD